MDIGDQELMADDGTGFKKLLDAMRAYAFSQAAAEAKAKRIAAEKEAQLPSGGGASTQGVATKPRSLTVDMAPIINDVSKRHFERTESLLQNMGVLNISSHWVIEFSFSTKH